MEGGDPLAGDPDVMEWEIGFIDAVIDHVKHLIGSFSLCVFSVAPSWKTRWPDDLRFGRKELSRRDRLCGLFNVTISQIRCDL